MKKLQEQLELLCLIFLFSTTVLAVI